MLRIGNIHDDAADFIGGVGHGQSAHGSGHGGELFLIGQQLTHQVQQGPASNSPSSSTRAPPAFSSTRAFRSWWWLVTLGEGTMMTGFAI